MSNETHRDSIAEILERIAKEGLPNPRDLDVALDAILSEESAYINRLEARIEELEAKNLKLGKILEEDNSLYQVTRRSLEAHIRVLLLNDPNYIISDGGHCVLDQWRHEARHTLQIKGTDDGD